MRSSGAVLSLTGVHSFLLGQLLYLMLFFLVLPVLLTTPPLTHRSNHCPLTHVGILALGYFLVLLPEHTLQTVPLSNSPQITQFKCVIGPFCPMVWVGVLDSIDPGRQLVQPPTVAQ